MTSEQASDLAKAYAERLEREQPRLAVSRMTRSLRTGKVLIDWSQNNGSKTTVAPYSLRARQFPTVSTPVTWAEVEACRQPQDLFFTAGHRHAPESAARTEVNVLAVSRFHRLRRPAAAHSRRFRP